MKGIRNLLLVSLLLFAGNGCRQNSGGPSPEIPLTDSLLLPATGIKDQAESGTCWAFGGVSLMESDLLRDSTASGEPDLSEMWLVRQAYYEKAVQYVRTRGYRKFSQGGELHDALLLTQRYGAVPQSVYEGNSADGRYDHAALARAVGRCARRIVNRKLYRTENWEQRIRDLLDERLGPCPERFRVGGIEYTPLSYADSIGLRCEEYVCFTSFTHHPFHTDFALELADNWMGGRSFNLPLDELKEVLDHAISQGYTVGWCGHIADVGFSWRRGIAGIRKGEIPDERSRQRAFDTQNLQDGHILHIVGIARRKNGGIYYKAKNSWGDNSRGGYVYLSENFIRKNTVELVVNRRAVPPQLLETYSPGE